MCCRRNRNRAPLIVILGKLAYDKYQQREGRKALTNDADNFERNRSPSPDVMEKNANAEILGKAGIAPPSYDDVVNNRDQMREERNPFGDVKRVGEKAFEGMEESSPDDEDEEVSRVADGFHHMNLGAALPASPAYANQRRGYGGRRAGAPSSCAQKRSAKAQRKTEKAAMEAERLTMAARM